MPFLKVWIHAVWSTAERKPLLEKAVRPKIFDHMKENGYQKGIFIDRINGHFDHVHVLFTPPNDQSISKSIQLMKGESSFWINKNSIITQKFQWQDEYYAASVSESNVATVRNYIDHQEEHHKNKTFKEEYEELLRDIKANLSAVQD